MTLQFYKYQGTGNDFVMIDNRQGVVDPQNHKLVQALCHRKFGIGADGLILIQNHADYDFEMVYYNADATQSMCGNGARCAVKFAHFLEVIGEKTHFLAIDGPHEAFLKDGRVHLKMNDVQEVISRGEDLFINTGSPHHIRFVQELDNYAVVETGRMIRYGEPYGQSGSNVNFAETQGKEIFVRTYERGVEDETLSCGTGVTAVCLAAALKGFQSPVKVRTLGGELQVSFSKITEQRFEDIYLIGPAEQVFEGNIEIK